jgi:hypothetical protein
LDRSVNLAVITDDALHLRYIIGNHSLHSVCDGFLNPAAKRKGIRH